MRSGPASRNHDDLRMDAGRVAEGPHENPMRVDEFDFHLPEDQIAQHPPRDARDVAADGARARDAARPSSRPCPTSCRWLRAGDVLVLNDTRVFPARLLGRRLPGGGRLECLLVERLTAQTVGPAVPSPAVDGDMWDALVHPGQRLRVGQPVRLRGAWWRHPRRDHRSRRLRASHVQLRAEGYADVDTAIEAIGHMPLPPYIRSARRLCRPRALPDRLRHASRVGRRADGRAALHAGAARATARHRRRRS